VSNYIQNGNSQMFLQSVFSAHYLDIFYIYMPLTSTVTLFQIAADNMISFPLLS
jgi:hypothetical protein